MSASSKGYTHTRMHARARAHAHTHACAHTHTRSGFVGFGQICSDTKPNLTEASVVTKNVCVALKPRHVGLKQIEN